MWMKVDDRLHAHRKTRKVVRSDQDKSRDIAPMGLWVIAGSWAGQNGTDGWVPEHELDRWDDDWETLAKRLVKAGYWWPEQRDEEPGYGFVDWEDYNPASGSSAAGAFGNHKRWHADKGIVKPGCPHCPMVPDDIDDPWHDSGGDVAPDSGGDIAPDSLNIALPDPTRPDPEPKKTLAQSADADLRDAQDADAQCATDAQPSADRFEEFWDTYGKKKDRKRAEQKWKLALKKKGVTPDLLIDRARAYVQRQIAAGKHPEFTKDAHTWLNGENWNDEAPTPLSLIQADRPRRNGVAFLPKCPTCNAPQEDTHYDDCPNQGWRPDTEGVGT